MPPLAATAPLSLFFCYSSYRGLNFRIYFEYRILRVSPSCYANHECQKRIISGCNHGKKSRRFLVVSLERLNVMNTTGAYRFIVSPVAAYPKFLPLPVNYKLGF